MVIINVRNLEFDGFERFNTKGTKHNGLLTACFNSENIALYNSISNVTKELNLVQTIYDDVEKTIPIEFTYHAYNEKNGRNIVLTISNN